MVITVIISPVNLQAANKCFVHHALSCLIKSQPQHKFIVCADASIEMELQSGNASFIIAPFIKKAERLSKLWQQILFRKLTKKLNTEVVLYFDAGLYIKSNLPCCFMVNPEDLEGKSGRSFEKIIKKAKSVLTFSETSKTDLSRQLQIPLEKMGVVHAAVPEAFSLAGTTSADVIKVQHTGGFEYFIYTGSFRDHASLINLLKAFSIFKKRQKTAWKLVLVNREQNHNGQLTEALKTYLYRNDVVVFHQEDETTASLLNAAYAFIYPSGQAAYGLYVLEAMHFGLPIIAADSKIVREIAGESVIYFNNTVNDLAEKMMELYKNEALRNRQIEQVKTVVQKFSWQKTAEEIWQGIEMAMMHEGHL